MRLLLPKLVPILLCATPLAAQLSGSYTIDSTGSGARNFTNFATAVFELTVRGISGPVTIDVAAGKYPGESLILHPVVGASSSNTVTFRGPGQGRATLSYVAGTGGGELGLYSVGSLVAEHFVVEGLDFDRGSAERPASLTGNHFTLRKCTTRGLRIDVRGDHFEFDACHIAAVKEPIRFTGLSQSIHHCHIQQLPGINGSGAVLNLPGSWTAQGRSRCYNNVIEIVEGYVSLYGGLDFVHNTVLHHPNPSTGSWSIMRIDGRYIGYLEYSNNIVVNLHSAALLDTGGNHGPMFMRCHDNLYHTSKSGNNRFRDGNQYYSSVAAFRAFTGLEANSQDGDPRFLDVQDLPLGLRLAHGSPALGKAAGTPAYVTDDYEGKPRGTPTFLGALGLGRPTSFSTFGAGCAGTQSHVPLISYGGQLKLGSSDFAVQVSNALGSLTGQAFLAVGVGKIRFNFGGNCDLLVDPLILLRTNVLGTGAGNGFASFKLPIPNAPALKGKQLHFQWGVTDAAAAGIQLAMSQGATLTF